MLDVALIDQHQIVDALADQMTCYLTGLADRNAVGNRALALCVGGALDGVDHGRELRRLHANDVDAGLEGARRGGDAGNQAAAAHGNHQRIQVRLVAHHFQADGALAGNDQGVIKGVDEGQAALLGQGAGVLAGLVKALAKQHHLGAEAARALELDGGGVHRHDDHRVQTEALRMVRHALCMVAGRGRNDARGGHARRGCGIDHPEQFVERAALLERGRELQVLELQEDLRPSQLGQRFRLDTGRVQHLAGNAQRRRFDVGQGDVGQRLHR